MPCITNWPPDIVFFSDENLGRQAFPAPLRDAGVPLRVFHTVFDSGIADTDWIPVVAQRGWIALTTDERLRYRAVERDAIMAANLGVIVLISGKTHPEKAAIFLQSRNRIINFIRQHEPPFIARLYRNRIDLWFLSDNRTL